MADPSFDFERSFARFTAGFSLPLGATASVRGSRAAELVARCVVEVGTSSYYSGADFGGRRAGAEGDLPQYRRRPSSATTTLFYTHMKRYVEKERLGKLRRILVVLGRIGESEDDELAYAYYAANGGEGEPYERKRWSRAYASRAYGYYRPRHVERGMMMTFKAAGLSPQGRLARLASRGLYWLMQARKRRFAALGF